MLELKHTYPGVALPDGSRSYGGNQCMSPDKTMSRCGCGVVAAADLLLYFHRYRRALPLLQDLPAGDVLPADSYEALTQMLRRKYFPLLYPFGTNGISLAMGLNHVFRKNGIALRARWDMSEKLLWTHMEEMLRRDIPVILAIGPNFPRLWRKNKETLYRMDKDGDPRRSTETNAHYVTITGLDEEWMRISSWGLEYYLSRREYEEYTSHFSSALVSNIIYIRR